LTDREVWLQQTKHESIRSAYLDKYIYMDKYLYLDRINYTGKLTPTLDVLSALQEAHLVSVPFENLDIHSGRSIELDPSHLFRKIVLNRRGGFCFELNSLFHWLLSDIGFTVKLAMGRVYDRSRNVYGPEFDHMLILANCNKQDWLVDVGFGDFSMHPLKFELNQPLTDTNGQFLIEKDSDEYFKMSRYSRKEERYIPEYMFSTVERRLDEFSMMCRFHFTSVESHFTRKRVCSIATATGRISLTDDKLIVTENGMRKEIPISTAQEFNSALARYFGINM
jgi:N-hydroxyarylamine O-acetyltransferase